MPRPPRVLHLADSGGYLRFRTVGHGHQFSPAKTAVSRHFQALRLTRRTNRQGGGHWFEHSIAH